MRTFEVAMNKKIFFLLIIIFGTQSSQATEQKKINTKELTKKAIEYLNVRTHINLDSDEALLVYLPQRLKGLTQDIKTNGITRAIKNITNDPDLDSSLFIFESEKPYRLIAYSRQPTWLNKTPAELQAMIWSPEISISLEKIIESIIVMAQKITTYATHDWPVIGSDELSHHVSYSTRVTSNNKSYVAGVILATPKTAAHIVLPHRIDQVLNRFKLEGFENVAKTIDQGLSYEYFYVVQSNYPYRFILHREPWAGLTSAEAGKVYSPHCTLASCDVAAITNGLVPIAREGGGFGAYLWQSDLTKDPTLKIVYVKPFSEDKNPLYLGTGLPADVPIHQARDLENFVKEHIALVKEIGLENTISTLRQKNTAERYIYIAETTPPYFFPIHFSPIFNQRTVPEVQNYINKFGKSSVSIKDIVMHTINLVNRGGGFHAYKFLADAEAPQKGDTLKVAYTLPFSYDNKNYYMSTGIPVEYIQPKEQKTITPEQEKKAAPVAPKKKTFIQNKLVFDYLKSCCNYDLQSDDAITEYLPARLKQLKSQIKSQGIKQAIEQIKNDPELDSYLFILEDKAPYRVLAYSRHPEWYNKTPEELHQLLPDDLKQTINLKSNILSIVKSAITIESYLQYQWLPDIMGNHEQTTFFETIKINNTSYVIGAALYSDRAFGHIIIPYNVNALIKQIKQRGLDETVKLITADPTTMRYFYIVDAAYPYRYIAYGNRPELINKTPLEQEYLDDPTLTQYNTYIKIEEELAQVAHQGGFHAYLWKFPGSMQERIRIAYAKTFEIGRKKYTAVNGYRLMISTEKIQHMKQRLDQAYNLNQTIGLENMISALKQTNKPDDYIFVVDAEPPYTYILHPSIYYNQKTAPEVQLYLNQVSKKFHLVPFAPKAAELARKGGGILVDTFFVNIDDPTEGIGLKVSFVKPFTINKNLYYLSSGYVY